jgi:ferredoxin
MAKINFVSHDGEKTTVEADDSMTIMNAAIDNGVAGIDAARMAVLRDNLENPKNNILFAFYTLPRT